MTPSGGAVPLLSSLGLPLGEVPYFVRYQRWSLGLLALVLGSRYLGRLAVAEDFPSRLSKADQTGTEVDM